MLARERAFSAVRLPGPGSFLRRLCIQVLFVCVVEWFATASDWSIDSLACGALLIIVSISSSSCASMLLVVVDSLLLGVAVLCGEAFAQLDADWLNDA